MKYLRVYILFILVSLLTFCSKNPVEQINYNDGEYILFIRNKGTLSEICTVRPDGSDIQVIASHDYAGEYITHRYVRARWSPDKSWIVIEGGPRESFEWNPLWLMDMNGNLIQKLVWAGRRPVWTSDGESVIYHRRRGYFALINDIYKVDINSLEEDTLIIAEDDTVNRSFYRYYLDDIFTNNNNKLLLYETYKYKDTSGTQHSDDSELIIFDYRTKEKFYLTDNNIGEGHGRISSNGSLIAYVISQNGISGNHIYLMKSDGDSIHQLTEGPDHYLYSYYFSDLCWSPDGKSIVYAKSDQSDGFNEYGDIFTIDVDTAIETRLTYTIEDSIIYYVMDWK